MNVQVSSYNISETEQLIVRETCIDFKDKKHYYHNIKFDIVRREHYNIIYIMRNAYFDDYLICKVLFLKTWIIDNVIDFLCKNVSEKAWTLRIDDIEQ